MTGQEAMPIPGAGPRNYVYITPNKNKGAGARDRFECFLRLSPDSTDEVIRGDVCEPSGQVTSAGFKIRREHVRKVEPAIFTPGFGLTIAGSKAGA